MTFLLFACVSDVKKPGGDVINRQQGTYGYDKNFLIQRGKKLVELSSGDGESRVLISPEYQGRVFTSTATGDTGLSFGWLNYKLLESAGKSNQFNPVGGEERFWMGPEGGQYSIYFKNNDSFIFRNWRVPSFIDIDPYEVLSKDSFSVTVFKHAEFKNYSGENFSIDITRKVQLLETKDINRLLHSDISSDVKSVAYTTVNTIANVGRNDWGSDRGLLSVWLLGMFTPSPETFVMIPFRSGAGSRASITDDYFGSIPGNRLFVSDSSLVFLCDGKFRSKIGVSPVVAKNIAAAFDFKNLVLTVVIPEVNHDAPYVNSKWEMQKEPYSGDAVNAYNDGPLGDGSQMGPFFEIESSSPALNLKQNQSASYTQTTCHFQGNYESLRQLSIKLTGIDPGSIQSDPRFRSSAQ